MALNFRYNNTNYKLATSVLGSDNFCYQENGNTYKIPASSTRGTSVKFYEDDWETCYLNNSSPTLCFRKNNTNYYCAKSISSVSKMDIPAGTYTPSAFETLIKQFISNNSSRTCSNWFAVTVNKQTINVSSGTSIYYAVNSSSPQGFVRSVIFENGTYSGVAPATAYNNSSNGFTNGRTYVTYIKSGGYTYTTQSFPAYANFNITVISGIKFK